jgi:CspA family cold shock protein
MNTGRIKFFNESKGYGFIIPNDVNQQEIFFHCTKVLGKVSNDVEVEYEVETNKKGLAAINVKRIS